MSAFDLREISDLAARVADARQQVQAVAAQDLVVAVDLDGLEEGVDGRAQRGDGGHGGGEVFVRDGPSDRGFGFVEGGKEGAFLIGFREFRVRAEAVFDAVLLLGLREEEQAAKLGYSPRAAVVHRDHMVKA